MERVINISKVDGVVHMDGHVDDLLSTLRNGEYVMTIKRKAVKRSLSQNALMWLWYACIEDETGQDRNDIHAHYCYKYLSRPIEWNGQCEIVAGGTSNLTTEQMTDFLNKVQADAATEFGITLPQPEDRAFEAFFARYK